MKTLTREELIEIEKEARPLQTWERKATICMQIGVGEKFGDYVIKEMYISTTAMWIHNEREADEYIKQIKECRDFMNKYSDYVKYRKD